MADLNLYTTNAGLRIVSDVADFNINEYSTKRNNLSNNELTIVSDLKDNYAEYDIIFSKWDNVKLNDTTYVLASLLQNALTNISQTVSISAGGKQTGTLFGDDIRTTRRVPIASGKYSQGLPIHAIDYTVVGSGYFKIAENEGLENGAAQFGTGVDSNGKIYVSSKGLNRYQAGQLSYYLFTAAWNGISSVNGDFTALVGASLRGLEVDGQQGDIKEGFMFGWVRISGVLKTVVRVYKNFIFTDYETDLVIPSATENLSIFEMEVGYLGIHPLLLYVIDTDTLLQKLLTKIEFNSPYTSVNDPNMSISVYMENQGNTTDITINNGSFQFGNYGERPSGDPSSRELLDTYTSTSISSGVDTVLSIYTVPNKVEMYDSLTSSGTTTTIFRNTIRNKLKKVIASGESQSSKAIALSIYLVPIGDITGASFIPVNPYINVLAKSSVGTVDFTNSVKILDLVDIRGGEQEDVRLEDYLLDGSLAGVVTVTSTANIAELRYTIITEDQF